MEESQYATVQELGKIPPCYPFNGKEAFPTDIAVNDNEEYYKLLQILASESEGLLLEGLQQFSVMKVQKIMDTKEGDLQWEILN